MEQLTVPYYQFTTLQIHHVWFAEEKGEDVQSLYSKIIQKYIYFWNPRGHCTALMEAAQ